MRGRHVDTGGINLNQLAELAKSNPQYTQLYRGLAVIDNQVKQWVTGEIVNSADASIYFIKTELMSQCYNLMLFNSERQATVGVSWPLADFLRKCTDKSIEKDVITATNKIIDRFGESNIRPEHIYWIN